MNVYDIAMEASHCEVIFITHYWTHVDRIMPVTREECTNICVCVQLYMLLGTDVISALLMLIGNC